MKSEFAFIALPVSALIAPSAFAVRYLTVDQAQQAIFPGKSFTAAPVKLTSVQRKAIEQASGVRVLHDEQWRAQFVGKTSKSTLKLDRDVKNISGATLSCRHITDGVKRLLAFYEIALRH